MAHQGWDSLTDRPAARRRRLPGDGDDAAGDLDHRHGAGRARAVARARHPDEGARRRRLRRHLPDGQHARRRRRTWSPGRTTRRAARAASARCARRSTAAPTTRSTPTTRSSRFAMIETAQALDNLDDILSVEGLDAIYIGPSDLSLSLGCTAGDRRPRPEGGAGDRPHPRARQGARRRRRHPQRAARSRRCERIAKGFQFVTVSSDARLMAAGAQQVLAKMRAAKSPGAPGTY